VVYIVLVSAALYALDLDRYVRHIYLVAVIYVIFRLLVNVAAGRALLMNWPKNISVALGTVILTVVVYLLFISRREMLMPSPRTLVEELWLVILVFVFHLLNRVRPRYSDFPVRRRRYVMRRYHVFTRRYGALVDSLVQLPELKALVYAIMVYEDFNRPWFFRLGERLLFPLGLVRTLGIMQVQTDRSISDEESIRIAVTRILAEHHRITNAGTTDRWGSGGTFGDLWQVAFHHNPDEKYARTIMDHWTALYGEMHKQNG
jgi:hypothetical protein